MAKLTQGTDKCRCTACGEYFARSGTFAKHRIGDWQDKGANRRCMTITQMARRGWKMDTEGFWRTPPMSAKAANAIRAQEG